MPKCMIEFDTPDQASYIPQVESILQGMGIATQRVNCHDIIHGALNDADMVTFPGGLGAGEGLRQYGENFAKAMQFFVASGGGYLGVCVPPDTLIFTNPKIKPISEVSVGDGVLTHGGYRKVTRTFRRPYQGDLLELKTWGGETLKLTPEHPVLAILDNYVGLHRCNRTRRVIDEGTRPMFIEAQSIKVGDLVLLAFPTEVRDTVRIDITKSLTIPFIRHDGLIYKAGPRHYGSPYTKHGVLRTKKRLRRFASTMLRYVEVNSDFLYLAGLYMAEGFSCQGRVHLSFGKHETQLIETAQKLFELIFKKRASLRETRTSKVVYVNSTILSNFFENLFGKGAKNKHIPPWMLLLPYDKQKVLLDGLFDGDGSKDDHRQRFCTISGTLAYQVRLILHRLGQPNGISHRCKGRYSIEGREGITNERFSVEYALAESRRFSLVDGHYAYLPVRKVSRVHYDGDVYNLEVKGLNSYTTVGGTVHNCGGAYSAGVAVPALLGLLAKQSLRLIDTQAQAPPLIKFLSQYLTMQEERLLSSCDISAISHPITVGHEGERVHLVYSGGPILTYPGSSVVPLAYYYNDVLSDVRGEVAIAVSQLGKGRVVVSGPHPEAPLDVGQSTGEPCCRWLYEAMVNYCLQPADESFFPTEIQPWKTERPLFSPAIPMAALAAFTFGAIITTKKRCG